MRTRCLSRDAGFQLDWAAARYAAQARYRVSPPFARAGATRSTPFVARLSGDGLRVRQRTEGATWLFLPIPSKSSEACKLRLQ